MKKWTIKTSSIIENFYFNLKIKESLGQNLQIVSHSVFFFQSRNCRVIIFISSKKSQKHFSIDLYVSVLIDVAFCLMAQKARFKLNKKERKWKIKINEIKWQVIQKEFSLDTHKYRWKI